MSHAGYLFDRRLGDHRVAFGMGRRAIAMAALLTSGPIQQTGDSESMPDMSIA